MPSKTEKDELIAKMAGEDESVRPSWPKRRLFPMLCSQCIIRTLFRLLAVVAAFSAGICASSGDRISSATGVLILAASIAGADWLLLAGTSSKAIAHGLMTCAVLALAGFVAFLPVIQQAR